MLIECRTNGKTKADCYSRLTDPPAFVLGHGRDLTDRFMPSQTAGTPRARRLHRRKPTTAHPPFLVQTGTATTLTGLWYSYGISLHKTFSFLSGGASTDFLFYRFYFVIASALVWYQVTAPLCASGVIHNHGIVQSGVVHIGLVADVSWSYSAALCGGLGHSQALHCWGWCCTHRSAWRTRPNTLRTAAGTRTPSRESPPLTCWRCRSKGSQSTTCEKQKRRQNITPLPWPHLKLGLLRTES